MTFREFFFLIIIIYIRTHKLCARRFIPLDYKSPNNNYHNISYICKKKYSVIPKETQKNKTQDKNLYNNTSYNTK